MRATVVAVALAEGVARKVRMPVGMTVCVIATVVVRGDVNRCPRATVGVVLEGEVQRHQQGLHQQAQTGEDSEESLHWFVPYFVPHSRRACEDWVSRPSSVAETIL